MPANSTPAEQRAVADASPNAAVNAAPAPSLKGKWAQQFAARLKANARWMKQFLHGAK